MNLTLPTLVGIAASLLAACTPSLNWRNVSLPEADLTITLPCKPDDARRTSSTGANASVRTSPRSRPA
ncbi:MAG: hypothetical protein K2Q97_02165, partial [Burkholderiaceae bacterium]|nr:hypothetical protein [Burkholderiaceae bacterium]